MKRGQEGSRLGGKDTTRIKIWHPCQWAQPQEQGSIHSQYQDTWCEWKKVICLFSAKYSSGWQLCWCLHIPGKPDNRRRQIGQKAESTSCDLVPTLNTYAAKEHITGSFIFIFLHSGNKLNLPIGLLGRVRKILQEGVACLDSARENGRLHYTTARPTGRH